VIPLIYSLRKEVRFEHRGETCLAISHAPLNVIRVSTRAMRVLQLCDGQKTVEQIAGEVLPVKENEILKICEYFNGIGFLETIPVQNDGYFPSVTIIIPTKNRKIELIECLKSVFSQDYPKEKMEVIVVDDGSRDGTLDITALFSCKVFVLEENHGQSYCRNLGAQEASGEILAFIDSDCVAEPLWLKELTSYFRWERLGAVGGLVDGYYEKFALDRYEKTFSPLQMGKYFRLAENGSSMLYVPTCNLLVRRTTYLETGGVRDDMRVGEDVDLCWRIRGEGHYLLYVPSGAVKHKHRNGLAQMLKRRAEYGTSEPLLYTIHPAKRKVVRARPLPAACFLCLCAGPLVSSGLPFLFALGCVSLDVFLKMRRLAKVGLGIGFPKVLFSTIRTYVSFLYLASFHLVRYHLLLLFAAGFLFRSVWWLCFSMLFGISLVDYVTKKPRLCFPSFFFYYTLEHVFYQWGVFIG